MKLKNYRKYIKIQAESLDDIHELINALEEVILWDGAPKLMIGTGEGNFYCYINGPAVVQ